MVSRKKEQINQRTHSLNSLLRLKANGLSVLVVFSKATLKKNLSNLPQLMVSLNIAYYITLPRLVNGICKPFSIEWRILFRHQTYSNSQSPRRILSKNVPLQERVLKGTRCQNIRQISFPIRNKAKNTPAITKLGPKLRWYLLVTAEASVGPA